MNKQGKLNKIEVGDIITYQFFYYAPRFKLNNKVGIIIKEIKTFIEPELTCYKTYCFDTSEFEVVLRKNIKKIQEREQK